MFLHLLRYFNQYIFDVRLHASGMFFVVWYKKRQAGNGVQSGSHKHDEKFGIAGILRCKLT